MATYNNLFKERKKEAKGPLDKANHVVKRMHMCYTYCHKQGNLAKRCWTLNLAMLPQKLKKVEREDGRNGKEDSMEDVFQDDSHVDVDVQTKVVPLKGIGEKLLESYPIKIACLLMHLFAFIC